MDNASERYASMVKAAAKITSRDPLTVSMVGAAADAQGVNVCEWFPELSRV